MISTPSVLVMHGSRCSRHYSAMADSTFEIEQSFVKINILLNLRKTNDLLLSYAATFDSLLYLFILIPEQEQFPLSFFVLSVSKNRRANLAC